MIISKKTVLIFFTAVILLAGIFTVVQPAAAAALPSLVPECARDSAKYPGGCNVCDAIGVGINVTKIMLGTLGSAALLMFVYGGVLMAISRGHSDQVQKGKDALTNAVKGVIIVLASWVVINYGLAIMLGSEDVSKPATILGQNWATVDCKSSFNTLIDCTGKLAGAVCGTGWVCDGKGECITKCDFVYPKYSCQEVGARKDCATDLCPGSALMQCCPAP